MDYNHVLDVVRIACEVILAGLTVLNQHRQKPKTKRKPSQVSKR